jgi:ribonuclease HIII
MDAKKRRDDLHTTLGIRKGLVLECAGVMLVGCDEAGCGALMGDLVAAVVGWDDDAAPPDAKDSKTLRARRRSTMAEHVRATCA